MHAARAAATFLGAAVAGIMFGQPRQPSELQKAVDEFRLQTRNLGLRQDSPVRARNGSHKAAFHGRVFENFRNDFLDAIPHEIRQRGGAKSLLRRHQFGFHVAGPVVLPHLYHGGRNTFFTFTYEGMRERVARSFLRTIPTMPERSGDWSQVVDQAGQMLPIYDPKTTSNNPGFNVSEPVSTGNLQYSRAPFPENRIAASRLDRVAQSAVRFYPAPNADAGPFFRNNYFIVAPEENRADGIISRVDHSMGEKHRLGFSFHLSNGLDGSAPWFPTVANPGSPSRERASRRATIDYVYTASARSVNTITADIQRDRSENIPELDGTGRNFPNYRFSPYLSMGRSYPESRNARNTGVLTESFAVRKGRHRLRAIAQLVREQINTYWPQYPEASFRFSAGITSLPGIVNTGHAFASFLLGAAEYAEKSVVISPSYFRRSRYLLAFRDQWEIRKGLTLSTGLNLQGSTPRVERYNRQSTISFTAINPANNRPGALIAAGVNGAPRAFQPTLWKAEPSASLAWNVFGASKTVIRAGYARSYSPIPVYFGQWGTQAFNGSPTFVSANPQLVPAANLADGLPIRQTFPDLRPDGANDTVADLIEPTGRQPAYQSASVSIEHELKGAFVITLSAGHSDGHNLLLSNSGSNPNAIPLRALEYRDRLNDESFNRSLRPFPQYQRFDVYSSWPEGRYQRDAAQVRVEKRTSGGLALSASYEFSKQMDDYSGPYGLQDFYNRHNEWSLTSSNTPHRLSLSYMYELPFGPNKLFFSVPDWRRYFVEGWSVSGMTSVTSGEPVALHPQFNNTGNVIDALHVDAVGGVDPHVPRSGPELWFNPAAFAQPADFTAGGASRTHASLRNPRNQNHDLAVNKRVAVSSERSLEFSLVGLNFINHADWNDPDAVIGPASAPNVNAGRIIGSRGGRVIQLGLRFSF